LQICLLIWRNAFYLKSDYGIAIIRMRMIGLSPIFSFLPAILIRSDAKLMQDSCKKMMCCSKMTDCHSICEIYDLLYSRREREREREREGDNYKFEKMCAIIYSVSFSSKSRNTSKRLCCRLNLRNLRHVLLIKYSLFLSLSFSFFFSLSPFMSLFNYLSTLTVNLAMY